MSRTIERLPNDFRGERTIFSSSGPTGELPENRLTERHRALLRYWRSKGHDGTIPRRADIEPLEIPRLLPNLLLWDVVDDDYECRLSGSEVDLSMGTVMKGCRLSDIKCPLIGEAKDEFDAVRDGELASFAERTMGWLGKPYLYYRHLLMPLLDDHGRIRILISLLTFHPVSELH
ncbi:MAG TPA: PAS domain-containing protein [Alphaproteobacteria bacterium]|nr:PAS domain-containing protein [Alphaproteobacteria bacterium]